MPPLTSPKKSFTPKKNLLGKPLSPKKPNKYIKANCFSPSGGIYCFHAEEPRWEATLRTTQKEGPNKGRKFFVCQEGQDGENCGFFLWEDEVEKNGGSLITASDDGEDEEEGGSEYRGYLSQASTSKRTKTPSSSPKKRSRLVPSSSDSESYTPNVKQLQRDLSKVAAELRDTKMLLEWKEGEIEEGVKREFKLKKEVEGLEEKVRGLEGKGKKVKKEVIQLD